MNDHQSPELIALFETYTGGPTGIGADLVRAVTAAGASAPLLVATGTDMALFPGDGRPPTVESFRLSTRGFKELAGVSHLGPALASIVQLRALGVPAWRADAERLLAATRAARRASSPSLWRDRICVEAFQGREEPIAAMLDWACGITIRTLETFLSTPEAVTAEHLRREYLEPKGGLGMNTVMIATFFLTGLDIAFRVNRWLDGQEIAWARAMVLVCGKQGRPTSGVTWTTNSICQIILGAAKGELPLERMILAPHAPSFTVTDPNDLGAVAAQEPALRGVWCYTQAISDLAPMMFAGYPRYAPGDYVPPVVTDETRTLTDMPRIAGPNDLRTMTTRLRLVMEDPRQLLSGCVTDYAAEQLRANGNVPGRVVVPGLDGYDYPVLP